MTRSTLGAIAIAVVVVAAGGLAWVALRPVELPAEAGTTLITAAGPDEHGRPAGDCRELETTAPFLLCWQAWRETHEVDPTKDYYRLKVYGSFGGDTGAGARWAVVRARLLTEPVDDVVDGWPIGTFDGDCEQMAVDLIVMGPPEVETLCGRTDGGFTTPDRLDQRVTWTCQGCLFLDDRDRAIALHQVVGLPPGTMPAWEVYADLG